MAALLWQAAELLGEQVREVLDLTHRHHLTSSEVAAVLQEPTGAIEEILRKVAAGYGAVVRARIVWRQGAPTHDALREQVAGESRFDASMVRRVAEHLRECDECRTASQVPVPPIEVFAAIPIAIAPDGFKEEVVEALAGRRRRHGRLGVGSTRRRRLPRLRRGRRLPRLRRARRRPGRPGRHRRRAGRDGHRRGHSPLARRPRPDDPTTEVPARRGRRTRRRRTEATRAVGRAAFAGQPSHPSGVAGAATGAAALGLAAGLGELPGRSATTAAPTGPMLPGGLGPMPPAPDFGPDVEPKPKAPVPSTLIAASMRKGKGPPPPEEPHSSRNRWILVAVATVAVIALLAYMLTQTGGGKKQALNTVNQTTTTEAPTTTEFTPDHLPHDADRAPRQAEGRDHDDAADRPGRHHHDHPGRAGHDHDPAAAGHDHHQPAVPRTSSWNFTFIRANSIKLHSGLHNGGIPYWDTTRPVRRT